VSVILMNDTIAISGLKKPVSAYVARQDCREAT